MITWKTHSQTLKTKQLNTDMKNTDKLIYIFNIPVYLKSSDNNHNPAAVTDFKA